MFQVKFLQRLNRVQALKLTVADVRLAEVERLELAEAEAAGKRQVRNAVLHLPAAAQTQRLQVLQLGERHHVVGLEEVAILEPELLQLWHVLDDAGEGSNHSAVASLRHDAVDEGKRFEICGEFRDRKLEKKSFEVSSQTDQ